MNAASHTGRCIHPVGQDRGRHENNLLPLINSASVEVCTAPSIANRPKDVTFSLKLEKIKWATNDTFITKWQPFKSFFNGLRLACGEVL